MGINYKCHISLTEVSWTPVNFVVVVGEVFFGWFFDFSFWNTEDGIVFDFDKFEEAFEFCVIIESSCVKRCYMKLI